MVLPQIGKGFCRCGLIPVSYCVFEHQHLLASPLQNTPPMKPIIKVENLSKCYRIGLKEKQHDTLFGQIAAALMAPVQNFKKLRSLRKFDKQDESVFWALKDVNFEVKEGEVLGIIGHNGAGKSTLLKILSRVTEPTTGRITIRGRVGALLEVGTGFHPELTGRENIYLNGTILGMTKKEIDRKLDEIVDFSGVEKYLDTPVKFYSSGMKVRLGFSVAAHLDPEILVIDEVLAVGDVEFQRRCLDKMQDVSHSGRTILFVSHNMAIISKLCHRGMVLKEGKISFYGDTRNAVEHYLHRRQMHILELKDLPRKFKTDDADYLSVRLLNERDEPTDHLLFRQPIVVEADLVVHNPIRAVVDIVIKSFDEVEIIHGGSYLQHTYHEFEPGYYKVRFELENNLIPGQYLLTIGIHHASVGTTIDYCENINRFEVVEAGFKSFDSYSLKTKYGFIAIPSKILIKKQVQYV